MKTYMNIYIIIYMNTYVIIMLIHQRKIIGQPQPNPSSNSTQLDLSWAKVASKTDYFLFFSSSTMEIQLRHNLGS